MLSRGRCRAERQAQAGRSPGFTEARHGNRTGVARPAVRWPAVQNYAQPGRPHYSLGRIEIPGGARSPATISRLTI